jgi:long-chain acyl-CoA synthetase
MPLTRETLLDFFADWAHRDGPFLVYDDGYRSWTYTYCQVAGAARTFAGRLRAGGIAKGNKVLFWSENRPEWIAAMWGCLLEGVIAVPVDYRASPALLERVLAIVEGKAILTGREVRPPAALPAALIWPLDELDWTPTAAEALAGGPPIVRSDIAEIIFTSGATADPKGVVITHQNILANIVPVEGEVIRYRRWGTPFYPIRFLNLLPLSHMFGQAMATFIPPMIGGVVLFVHGYNPDDIARHVRRRRVSVVVCVPKILEVLRNHVARRFPTAANPPGLKEHFLWRWWRHRAVHRMFGWKFWSFVVGAAPLEPALEEYWSRLGYLVIQGYGLTETAPIVTLNHPFHAKKGTVGKPIAGVEVKLAADGEILVRGGNVTSGYYNASPADQAAFHSDGWFHTGDIGEMDAAGELAIRGRKKEMIVTPEGLNVFPEDVERVLNGIAGVRESAVIGRDRVHAVLVLESGHDPAAVVREANARLEDHQKVRDVSVWPQAELPRTEGTRKLKRREIDARLASGTPAATGTGAGDGEATIEQMLARYAGSRAITASTTIDELGLTSLERVEFMMALEQRFHTTVDESGFAQACTVADLHRQLSDDSRLAPRTPEPEVVFPRWNRGAPARWLRRLALPFWLLPLMRLFAWVRVSGREHLEGLPAGAVFASNHQSHLDVPVILAALPYPWRYRVAPAMSKEFFAAHFFPERHGRFAWFTNSLNYYLSTLFFNAFPLPQRESGARQAMRYMGELSSDGWSILIFPEGKRTMGGEIYPFQPGIGMIASRLDVPVVPVRIEGVDRVLHQTWKMARPGSVKVRFGAPLRLEGDDFASLARRVEEAVRAL